MGTSDPEDARPIDAGGPEQVCPPICDPGLREEVARIGVPDGMVEILLKPEFVDAYEVLSEVAFLPIEQIGGYAQGTMTNEETRGGLDRAIGALRSHGQTRCLAASLLGRARLRGPGDDPFPLFDLILDAIDIYRDLGTPRDLGRAHVELAALLFEFGLVYEALTSCDLATDRLAQASDPAGLAACAVVRASVCYRLDLPFEAERLLDEAEKGLPPAAVFWRSALERVRSLVREAAACPPP